ncbi:MAG: hypothetical protein KAJ75_02455 [Alphaproteobacteria bacterium]|nr:hypothetical protein [Alphaproteobacteria bacterium]
MAIVRTVFLDNGKDYQNKIDSYLIGNYRIIKSDPDLTIVKKDTWGSFGEHLLIFLFTAWFSLGLVNVLGAFYSRATAEEIKIILDKNDEQKNRIIQEEQQANQQANALWNFLWKWFPILIVSFVVLIAMLS